MNVPAIPFRRDTDLSGLSLERGPTGHVHSPWFTMPQESEVIYFGHQYQSMKRASVDAFSSLLGISAFQVIVTERKELDGERWWRLGSNHPVMLPERKRERIGDGLPAIDV